MHREFAMPDVGEGLTEAEIVTWNVAVGDAVVVNQILCEIETAKAAVELPSPFAGTIGALLAQPGETVAVGRPIVVIETAEPGGAAPAAAPAAAWPRRVGAKIGEAGVDGRIATLVGYGPRPGSVTRRPRRRPRPRCAAAPAPAAVPATAAPAPPHPPSPCAARPARRWSPPPSRAWPAAAGSGDVAARWRWAARPRRAAGEAAGAQAREGPGRRPPRGHPVARRTASSPARTCRRSATAPRPSRRLARGRRRRASGASRSAASARPPRPRWSRARSRRRTSRSSSPSTSPRRWRCATGCAPPASTPTSGSPRWRSSPRRCAWPPGAHPRSTRTGTRRRARSSTTTASSSASPPPRPRGLIVPKIRDADALSLAQLATALGALTATARDGKTPPADLVGGTFTITNVGVFGVDTGTPILNPGEAAILAVGSIKQAPWVVDGELAVRTVVPARAVVRPPPRRRRAGQPLPRRRRTAAGGPGSGADVTDGNSGALATL